MRIESVTCCLAALLLSGPASAKDEPLFRQVGNWDIRVDTTLGNGCFAYASWKDGSVFRVGINMEDENLLILMGNDNWESIEYGKAYEIALFFGNETPWEGSARGFSFDPPKNEPFLMLQIDGDEQAGLFIEEFMSEQNVDIHYNGESISNLVLTDSYKAGMALFECQEQMIGQSKDPFRVGPGSSKDPFKTK